jgi:hypothetical protein
MAKVRIIFDLRTYLFSKARLFSCPLVSGLAKSRLASDDLKKLFMHLNIFHYFPYVNSELMFTIQCLLCTNFGFKILTTWNKNFL